MRADSVHQGRPGAGDLGNCMDGWVVANWGVGQYAGLRGAEVGEGEA